MASGASAAWWSATTTPSTIWSICTTLPPTERGAARLALAAGVDIDLPSGAAYATLAQQVRDGRVPEASIDAAVRRLLTMKFRAGLFEQPFVDADAAVEITNNPEARALALKAAQRSVILLKNDGTLPLALPAPGGAAPVIAVIGPNAAVARLGGYYGQPPVTVSLLEGIRNKVGGRAKVLFAQGVHITVSDDWWSDEVQLADPAENRRLIGEALGTARQADRIVLAIGDTEQTSREGWAKNHLGDRPTLDLVGEQQALFDALHALGKPLVVVLINGRPASTVTIAEQANALLEAWYVGEQGGTALADVLFGDVNPGGKLPVTIPAQRRTAALVLQRQALRPSRLSVRHGRAAVSVRIRSELQPIRDRPADAVAPQPSAGGARSTVSVPVRNLGARAGDETVQIYVHQRLGSVTRPVKALKAFQRVSLGANEARTLTFRLDAAAFRLWNIDMQRVVEPGTYDILAGNNSADLKIGDARHHALRRIAGAL